jgi:DNA-binding transcriptional LysR family regulator
MSTPLSHDLVTLRLYILLCETRSFTAAGKRLNLAISAASRRIRLFEESAGVAFFKRLPHGIEPTAAGLTALRYARAVVNMTEEFAGNMEEYASGVRGRVRVCASSSALVQRLAGDLADFAKENPAIKIDLEERPTSETLEALLRGQADIGVVVRGAPIDGLSAFSYSRDVLAVVMRRDHVLAHKRMLKMEDIVDEDLVSLDDASAIYRLLVEKAAELGRHLRLQVKVRSFEVACQMVRQGLGISVLPGEALRPVARALDLALVPLSNTWARREFDVCYPDGSDLPAPARRLADLLRARADRASPKPRRPD